MILHSRNVAFLEGDSSPNEHDTEEVLIPVAPPAEGETGGEHSSKTARPAEPEGQGGEISDIKATEPLGSKASTTHTSASSSSPASLLPIQSTQQVSAPLFTLSTSSQSSTPLPAPSTKAIKTVTAPPRTSSRLAARTVPNLPNRSLDTSMPVQTQSKSTGQPNISLESERGAPKITIRDNFGKALSTHKVDAQANSQPESANICVDSDLAAEEDIELYGDEDTAVDSPPIEYAPGFTRLVAATEPDNEHQTRVAIVNAKATEYGFAHALYEGVCHQAFSASTDTSGDSPTYEEAMAGPERHLWIPALQEEIGNLTGMNTFDFVSRPPPNVNVIGCKWVLTKKRDESGKVVRYKARLVAKGFTQIPGQDFFNTFAPVLHLDTLRILIAIAVAFNLDIHQLDVVSAYLNGKLDEELYMEQIPGFDDGLGTVLKLNRSIYGLKQAANVWNRTLDTKLKGLGYQRLLTDSCVYKRFLESPDGPLVSFLAVHVDDSIVITTPGHTKDVIAELLREFNMRDLGELKHFIGITFDRDRRAGTLKMHQENYCMAIVDEANMSDAVPASTPAATSTQLTRHEGPSPQYPYARMIGRLMYAAICTRPDIAFAVNHLAQFTSCFGPTHVTAVKRVIRYLKGTSAYGLIFRSSVPFGEYGYADADWGANHIDRKSISGNAYMLGGTAISWSSKKQPTVALSTMEAEYMSLSHAATQALWIRQLFEEIGLPSEAPTTILSDNLAALTLSVESQYRGRSKHIDIRHHFMRDCIENRKLTTLYVNTKENLADALTKPLPTPQFYHLIEQMMGEQEDLAEES